MKTYPPAGGGAFLPGLKTRGILRRFVVRLRSLLAAA